MGPGDAPTLRTALALKELDHAGWQRRLVGNSFRTLVHHSYRDSQHLAIRYTERLHETYLGSVVEFYDNAAPSAEPATRTNASDTAGPGTDRTPSSTPP